MARHHITYYRVSTRAQDTASQKIAIAERLSQLTEPWEPLEDEWTGTDANRDGYQKMLRQVNAGQVISILTWRTDRIGRNAKGNLILAEACKARGTDIVGIGDGLQLKGPSGHLIFGILSAIAEYEAEKISANTIKGMENARAAGKIIGGSPAGYVKQHILDLVPTILMMQKNGYSVLRMARDLKVERKSISRVLAMIAAGEPLRSRAEMLKEVPQEKRGKAYHKGLEMTA
jgi:putative DNA-invertase from lambdoid prophage Rac